MYFPASSPRTARSDRAPGQIPEIPGSDRAFRPLLVVQPRAALGTTLLDAVSP
jgi:hypothetical protein